MTPEEKQALIDAYEKMSAEILNWPGIIGLVGCSEILAKLYDFRLELIKALDHA